MELSADKVGIVNFRAAEIGVLCDDAIKVGTISFGPVQRSMADIGAIIAGICEVPERHLPPEEIAIFTRSRRGWLPFDVAGTISISGTCEDGCGQEACHKRCEFFHTHSIAAE